MSASPPGERLTTSISATAGRVALLGSAAREQLLGHAGGVGSWIRLGGRPFQVIGVLNEVGTQLVPVGSALDSQVWIPLTTFQDQWPRDWTDDSWIWTIFYQVRDRSLLEETEEEIQAILAEQLRVPPDDDEAMHFFSPLKILSAMPIAETQALLFVLAVAILVIGGVGTLNMMLDSVHERRQEIGVRLAIGASRHDVVMQFFFETLTLVGLAGLLGVALGVRKLPGAWGVRGRADPSPGAVCAHRLSRRGRARRRGAVRRGDPGLACIADRSRDHTADGLSFERPLLRDNAKPPRPRAALWADLARHRLGRTHAPRFSLLSSGVPNSTTQRRVRLWVTRS